jgi:hypothetical protein
MSFPPATEMFQFAGFASTVAGRYRFRGGLPHSEISGSKGAPPSPELFAGCHVLRRLSVPRHPPNALTYRSRTSRSPCANTPRCRSHGNRTHTNTHGRATDVREQMSENREHAPGELPTLLASIARPVAASDNHGSRRPIRDARPHRRLPKPSSRCPRTRDQRTALKDQHKYRSETTASISK